MKGRKRMRYNNIREFVLLFQNNPVFAAIFAVLAIGAAIMLFIISRKRILHTERGLNTVQEGLGLKEWAQMMSELSLSHQRVKWKRINRIVAHVNQKAYRKMNFIHSRISVTSPDIIALIPSARWLFDNFQMMYREIKKMKTTGTGYITLPILESTMYRGYPRIYVVAKKMVEISGGYLNEENISFMIKAYQKETPLTERELLTLLEMIGLCLLERIISVSEDILNLIDIKTQAERFVKEKLVEKQGYLDITLLLADWNGYKTNITFHSHVIYLLRNRSIEETSLQRYLAYHFGNGDKMLNLSELFKEEGRQESLLESCIRTPVISLRELNQINEEELVEELSIIESILSKDPDGVYPNMDSSSRGMYRSEVEKLARRYNLKEAFVAETCIRLSRQIIEDLHCSSHVGTYLIGKGYPLLKAAVRNKPFPPVKEKKFNIRGLLFFLLAAAIFTFSTLLILAVIQQGYWDEFHKIILMLIAAAPLLMDASLKTTTSIMTRLVPVQKIPYMNYSEYIPDKARTFVVMPVIVSSKEQCVEFCNRMHKHYLANRQPNLYFALLADFADADAKDVPDDAVLKETLISQIDHLNKTYPSSYRKFSLFIRERRWNPGENCFMCWERKRGKLEEFNALLNGIPVEETSFTTIHCDRDLLTTFKYVITLDADSDLVKDHAAKLVGMIDHPLHRARIDPARKNVQEGYGIIQPMVLNHIHDKNSALFPKIFGRSTGLANYSLVISDIYQDLFGKGSFVGKGIYNVHAFHELLYRKIPENRVLSHDLLESCYVTTAFVSTANIVESFPGSYISYAKREHRWIRGDWQLLPLLFRKDLGPLCKWKILDTLRISLLPINGLLLIFLNILLIPRIYWLWLPIMFYRGILDLTVLYCGLILYKIRRPRLALVYFHLLRETIIIVIKAFLDIVLIPTEAFNALDAIVKTLYRMMISKKHLLMWNTSENIEKSAESTVKYYFKNFGTSCILSAAGLAAAIAVNAGNTAITAVYGALMVLWGTAFYAAYRISMRRITRNPVSPSAYSLLNDAARRMWRFFRTFATKENNWLCPDNYQIARTGRTTDKTSPTNIGLQFLSILSARDFGFETLSTVIDYTENLMYTVNVLPKWNGHLFNWYDIKTLAVLEPRYVSTVDSGNFFGDLVALKNGLLEQKNTAILNEGLLCELRMLAMRINPRMIINSKNKTAGEFLEDLSANIAAVNETDVEDSADHRDFIMLVKHFAEEVEKYELQNRRLADKITLSDLADSDNTNAINTINRIAGLCDTIDNMLKNVSFFELYNKKRNLFHIGYNATTQVKDQGCYDLIASESLLTSYLAIARGEVPPKHWQKLSRPLTMIRGIPAHVSWSGTMFEYLMPNLLLKEYPGSVFADSSRAAVIQQIKHARRIGIPWGFSESQYHRFDINSNYQYRAFGVPKLRLQPSYMDSRVIAPYAVMLALEYAGGEAIRNLLRIKKLKAYDKYGFYEAIDFDAPDPIYMTDYCIVRSFMAHHLGMSLVAINNCLNNGIMRQRFHAEPFVKSCETMLEEKRQTWFISISKKGYTLNIRKRPLQEDDVLCTRHIKSTAPPIPVVNYLSNGSYSLLITSNGDGFSTCGDMIINRWRPDIYAQTGQYIYVKDVKSGRYWSVTYNPTKVKADEYQAIFSHHQSEFFRKDGDISTYTIVSLSIEHDLEIRKVTLKNYGEEEKQIALTSYVEVVGDSYAAESSHPAFNKLFIESEYIRDNAVFVSRRRSDGENENPYILHMVRTGESLKNIEYENDRGRFIGRNNTLEAPDAIRESTSLSNSDGFSCDPIMSLRTYVNLVPGGEAAVTFITGICKNREEILRLSDEFSIAYRVDDVLERFRLQSIMELKYLGISGRQLNAFQNIISPLFYPSRYYRGSTEIIRRNWKDQNSLWRYGISGDNPIMLMIVNSAEEAEIIREVLKLYEYLRINLIKVDLVILSEAKYGYMQELDDLINSMTTSLKIYDDKDKPGIFLIHSYQLVPAEADLLYTVAKVVFDKNTGIYFRNTIADMKNILAEGYV